jgi:hypothetical protein
MIELTTKCDHWDRHMGRDIVIPAGSKGNVIDIMIEEGRVLFLLEFDNSEWFDWFSVDEIEEKY